MSMKTIGTCEQCSKGGTVEMVEVAAIGDSGPVVRLHLCHRCATQPNAVWRRRFQPFRQAAGHPS
jgi:hypothetical protein